MNIQEFRQLQAEKSTLERLITQLPLASIIERMSLEARKKEVEDEISSQPPLAREPAHVRLTFSGKPIVKSHGMFAEFGAAVIEKFANAVATIGANQTFSLGSRGVIPKREDYQLLITGTALGSFGFELEEAPREDILFPELSPVESAIEQAKAIMKASLGTDDELTEAISEVDERVLKTMQEFLGTMVDNEAVCTIEFKEDSFRFTDVGQVRRSKERLNQDNIHEEDMNINGHFQGVLPKRRTFEFMVQDNEVVISGKVGPKIEDAGAINHLLEKPMRISVHTTRVGEGNPRYVLVDYKEIREVNLG